MIRKHIHRHPCVICSSAAAKASSSSSHLVTSSLDKPTARSPTTSSLSKVTAASINAPHSRPKATISTAPRRVQQQKVPKRNSSVATSLFPNDTASQSMVSDEGLTSLQLRERDYQTYLDLFVNNSSTTMSQSYGVSSSGKFCPDASLWRRFTEGSNTLTLEEYNTLARGMVDSIPTQQGINTPTINTIPPHATTIKSNYNKVKEVDVITIDVSVHKQQQFFTCLSDFDALMREAGVSYFLCCGTALGMIRESRFIPHDNDIDVGIMFTDGSTPKPCEITQEGILILLGHLHTSTFVCIDCIGEVDKGLEIRLQHQDTGVLLDINLYYSSEEESGSSSKGISPFVWCATHYAESTSRKHGMYRYKHTPFLDELTRVSIRSSSKTDKNTISAYLPPTLYLEEYFGSDWTVPKKFTYEEGLKGEYKNIIQE